MRGRYIEKSADKSVAVVCPSVGVVVILLFGFIESRVNIYVVGL